MHRLWEPLADKRRPVSSYGAKFSLPYSIAVMLVLGRAGLSEFTDEAIQDAEVLKLAAKVGYVIDPTIDYPRHFSGHVKVVLEDGTVRGGTGWGAEFAKLCNKPLHVFDQERDAWFTWDGDQFSQRSPSDSPVITHPHFTGTGTRTIRDNGRAAIEALFTRSFGAAS